MEDEEHEVYGGEIPDEADMDADVDMATRTDEDAVKVSLLSPLPSLPHPQFQTLILTLDFGFYWIQLQELDEMKKRLKEMEEEAAALREMQAKVEKEMGGVPGPISQLLLPFWVFKFNILMLG